MREEQKFLLRGQLAGSVSGAYNSRLMSLSPILSVDYLKKKISAQTEPQCSHTCFPVYSQPHFLVTETLSQNFLCSYSYSFVSSLFRFSFVVCVLGF